MLTVKQTADEELEALHSAWTTSSSSRSRRSELLARVRAVLRRAENRRA